MALTAAQQKRVDYYVEEEWLSDDVEENKTRFEALLVEIESPLELFAMIKGSDWGTSTYEIKRMLNHPKCDAGTLLMGLWWSQPDYYCKYESISEMPNHELEAWSVLTLALSLLETSQLELSESAYDPNNDQGENRVADFERVVTSRSIVQIPEKYKRPIVGS